MKPVVMLYFITGFLGSGKTTFLSRILSMIPEEKIGLIINEFGQTSVDGAILRETSGMPIAEINNGQVFCGCVSGNFVDSICEFFKLPIRHLIVETSGMANPVNIKTVLEAVRMQTSEAWEYKGMICVVDPTTVADLAEVVNAVREQIAKSDYLIINKMDLMDPVELVEVEGVLDELNSHAPRLKTSFGEISSGELLDFLNRTPAALENVPLKVESDFRRPLNYRIRSLQPASRVALETLVSTLMADSLRIKGYARLEDGQVYLVNGASRVLEMIPSAREESGVDLVLITARGDLEETIRSCWQTHLASPVEVEEKGREYWD